MTQKLLTYNVADYDVFAGIDYEASPTGYHLYDYMNKVKFFALGLCKTNPETEASGSIIKFSVSFTPMSSGVSNLNSFV